MSFPFDREWAWGLAAVAALATIWVLDPADIAELARDGAFEAMGEVLPRPATPNGAVVVDIDRESLAQIGPWPWRRSQIADLIDRIAAESPSVIAVDILLAGADRRGPAALAQTLSEMSGSSEIDGRSFVDDDKRLAEAIAEAGNVVLGLVLDDAGRDAAPIPTPLAAEGDTSGLSPRATQGLLAPYEPLAKGAAGVGVLSFQEGALGGVASAPLIALAAGDAFPGFAVETLRVAQNASTLILKDAPYRLEIGDIEIPLDGRAEMRLHFSSVAAWPFRTFPAWILLSDSAPEHTSLAGRIVLIGSSAPEAGAFLPIAGSPLAPTVQIQAEAIDQILARRFLYRPATANSWEVGAMVGVGIAAVAIAVWLPPAFAALAALGLAAIWLAFTGLAFLRFGLLVDPVGPAAMAIIAANITEIASFIRLRALKTAIVQKFERYVPPQVVARLVREPESLKLDGELREVTALITDVEDFSQLTERADPRALVRVLDTYFDQVTELIVAHGGMVDKIVGDAVLAFFNIPAPLPDHAQAAVRCAGAILSFTEAFRGSGEAAALGLGRTRIGIETGPAIVGDVGGRRRLDYTAYGVVVNTAARLQTANKALQSSICIGPDAAASLGGALPLRSLGRIEIRGIQAERDVYEPWQAGVSEPVRELYNEAVALLGSDQMQARERFAELAQQLPDDRVVAMWIARLSGVT